MHGDVVHVPRPHQQRIRRIRGSLVAVPAALHYQPQIIFPREVHRRRDVIGIACRYNVDAGFAHPRVHPSQCLRQARLVTREIGIVNVVEQVLAARASRVFNASLDRKLHRNQISVDIIIQPLPRRLRRPIRIRRPPPPNPGSNARRIPQLRGSRSCAGLFGVPHSSRAHSGPKAAIPDRVKNALLSIEVGKLATASSLYH